jgi:hypothetical protein
MGNADSIVNMAFGLTLGAVAVAFALAFGLGGREAAARFLKNVQDKAERETQAVANSMQQPVKEPTKLSELKDMAQSQSTTTTDYGQADLPNTTSNGMPTASTDSSLKSMDRALTDKLNQDYNR